MSKNRRKNQSLYNSINSRGSTRFFGKLIALISSNKGFRKRLVLASGIIFLLFNAAVFLIFIFPDTNTRRCRLVQEWLQAAQMIAQKTQDKEALFIADFLNKNTIIGSPEKNGAVKALTSGSGQYLVAVIPILKDDENIPFLKKYSSFPAIATFNYDKEMNMPFMVFKTNHSVSSWIGFQILHEGFHALCYFRNPQMQNHEEYCREEVSAHQFENRLLEKFAGKRYSELLGEYVSALTQANKFSDLGVVEFLPDLDTFEDIQELEEIFGPSQSGPEYGTRKAAFFIHVIFNSIDRISGRKDDEAKSRYLLRVYLKSGVLK